MRKLIVLLFSLLISFNSYSECMSKADANKLGFTEDSKYVKICRDPDFYMGLDAWQRGSHYDKYLTEFGLPSNYLNDALLRVYFEYMVFRDWNNRKLVTNSEFNKIKDITIAIQGYYEKNSTFPMDNVWDIASKIFDVKSNFYLGISSSDYSFILNSLERHNNRLNELTRRFGLNKSYTTKDI